MNTSETMFLLRAVTVRASIYMKALIQYVVLHTMIGYSDRGILQMLFSTVVILLVCGPTSTELWPWTRLGPANVTVMRALGGPPGNGPHGRTQGRLWTKFRRTRGELVY